jgi:arginyl-tRNA synthetase
VFTESQGAIVFEGSHTRVFITAEGNPTYEAKDLALEIQKTKDWPCDLIVITTASEQNEYFKVVFEALLRIQPDLAGRLKHIGFGMINLKTGKMSSRTGNIVGGVELVEEVVKQVGNEQVGLGAVKYGFLKSNPLQNMAFELESSIATEGNSGPYLLYTYARARRVMEKSQTAKVKSQKLKEKLITTDMESELLRYLYRFAEVVQEAAERYSPNLVCNYLYELASRYNRMYNADVILGNMLREKLTEQTAEVLRKGLALLGIEAVERM